MSRRFMGERCDIDKRWDGKCSIWPEAESKSWTARHPDTVLPGDSGDEEDGMVRTFLAFRLHPAMSITNPEYTIDDDMRDPVLSASCCTRCPAIPHMSRLCPAVVTPSACSSSSAPPRRRPRGRSSCACVVVVPLQLQIQLQILIPFQSHFDLPLQLLIRSPLSHAA